MLKKPGFIKTKIVSSPEIVFVKKTLKDLNLNVICYEASCPNAGECFSNKQTTFLILGKNCTRSCLFCDVTKKKPDIPDKTETRRVVQAALRLGLKYAVITSPTRDDLKDGGASFYAEVIKQLKNKGIKTEVLIPDFKGNKKNIDKIINARPEVISHNIEMAENLYPAIRPLSDFKISLDVLKYLKQKKCIVKTAFLIGFGEKEEEILNLINKLAFVDVLYIGQYLRPSKKHYEVQKYYSAREFKKIKNYALKKIRIVKAGTFIRSSYKAYESFKKLNEI